MPMISSVEEFYTRQLCDREGGILLQRTRHLYGHHMQVARGKLLVITTRALAFRVNYIFHIIVAGKIRIPHEKWGIYQRREIPDEGFVVGWSGE